MRQAGQHSGAPPSGGPATLVDDATLVWCGNRRGAQGAGSGPRMHPLASADSLPFQTVATREPTETARAREIWGLKILKVKNLGTEARRN